MEKRCYIYADKLLETKDEMKWLQQEMESRTQELSQLKIQSDQHALLLYDTENTL